MLLLKLDKHGSWVVIRGLRSRTGNKVAALTGAQLQQHSWQPWPCSTVHAPGCTGSRFGQPGPALTAACRVTGCTPFMPAATAAPDCLLPFVCVDLQQRPWAVLPFVRCKNSGADRGAAAMTASRSQSSRSYGQCLILLSPVMHGSTTGYCYLPYA